NIDNICNGRVLLSLYRVTGDEKYFKAASTLREQIKGQPRTKEGGFWHKKRYPYQMWLDGLYMGEPFYTEYAAVFHQPEAFDDIANQFIWMEQHARDAKTGLLYHGWDESKQEKWANKTTGLSPNFWARAMGWYGMALVDVLDNFPVNHPKRKALLDILDRFAKAVKQVQDPKTGLWWDILNMPGRKGNYPEASASAMFVYALAKGTRLHYLSTNYWPTAKKGFDGITKTFMEADANGVWFLKGTVSVSGLGGNPYRDGSYEYYISEKVINNDAKGMGAFLLAANEMELVAKQPAGAGKTVLLDYYFNNEWKKDITGQSVRYHYTWDDRANSGFSLFGDIFRQHGASLDTLPGAPTAASLKNASVYIITDPDTDKETAHPNYVSPADAKAVYDWVSAGGVLLLLMNDSGNCEFSHFNLLPEKFGIHFNEDSRNRVVGHEYATGGLNITVQDAIFRATKKIYIKEISTLKLSSPAKAHYTDGRDVIMAVSKVGKGTVFAVGDPWFYNEYLDGRKLPAEYQNFQAAQDLVKWLLTQVPPKRK
ncbi:MAG: glycoside hydrolase family 88 protein, partial [Bacteroidetes bacterium]|nr:glycoside hydrolase family 88 protein [Bacteroidota bacterium]